MTGKKTGVLGRGAALSAFMGNQEEAEPATPLHEMVGQMRRAFSRRATQTTPPQPGETDLSINDNRTLDVETAVNIDGRCLSSSVARNQREVRERAGFDETPWQRRAAVVRAQELPEAI